MSQNKDAERVASLARQHGSKLCPALAAVLHRHIAPLARFR